jgi:prepilin-type N-terminal cleavage/methylation domain-containing protein
MKLNLHPPATISARTRTGFTLPEVLVSVVVVAIMFVSLYAGISQGFAIISAARENLRGTQIMVEKMEVLRLYTWDQLNRPGFIPDTFSDSLVPDASSGEEKNSSGTVFHGTISTVDAPGAAQYATGLKEITLTLTWTNGAIVRTRSARTYVGQNGLQQYIY